METPISQDRVIEIAIKASDLFTKGASESPDSAILDVIGSTPYSRRQLDRIAQATNQAVWAKMMETKEASSISFPLANGASLSDCLQKVASEEIHTKVASSGRDPILAESLPGKIISRLEQTLGIDQVKTASVDPMLAFPSDTRNWHQVSAKLRKAAEEARDRRHRHYWEARDRLNQLVKQATLLLKEGVSPSFVIGAVRRSIPDQDMAVKVAAYVHQEAIKEYKDPLELARELFEPFVKRAAGRGGVPTRLLKQKEGRQEDKVEWSKLDRSHPLCKLAAQVAEDVHLSCLHEKAVELLEDQQREAFKLSCTRAPLV